MTGDKRDEEGVGFAGIATLLPEITPEPVLDAQSNQSRNSESGGAKSSLQGTPGSENKPSAPESGNRPQSNAQPHNVSQWVSNGAALALIVIVVLWVATHINSLNSQQNTPPKNTASLNLTLTGEPQEEPNRGTPSRAMGEQSATQQDFESSTQQKPPIGYGKALSLPEIRYCLAERVRITGAKSAVNTYNQSEVSRFNSMVDDYNSRCSNYRYLKDAMDSARQYVAQHQNELLSEGRARFPPSLPSHMTNRAMVKAVQQKLSELGYNIGVPDGVMGEKTRAAIMIFQLSAGLVVDGKVSKQLLMGLDNVENSIGQKSNAPDAGLSESQNSDLTVDEKNSIQLACAAVETQGEVTYKQCLINQLTDLGKGPREPSLKGLTSFEKYSIRRACVKTQTEGVVSYNKCIITQLHSLGH